MKLSDPLKIAYRSLSAAKLRFFLTMLGVVIGVAAVIMVMSVGASAQKLVLSQVEKVGSNLIGIIPGASEEDGPPAQALGVVTTTLTADDLKAIRDRRNAPHIMAASGYVTGSATVEAGSESRSASFQGVSPQMIEVEDIDVSAGRFFFPEEEEDLSRVAVLGFSRAEDLFQGRNPLGETVAIKDVPFRVVGVLEKKGSSMLSNPDDLVYVPVGTARKLLLGIDYLNFVRAKVDSADNVSRTIADVTALLRDRHDLDEADESDFSVKSTAAVLKTLSSVTDVLKYFLSAIAGISLLVGGIGIMNSMLISVSQRVREIGLRKSVGARPYHIIAQFLIESSFITLLGGLIGIFSGIGITYAASAIITRFGYEWEFIISPGSIALGFFVSLAIGLIFGLYPALKASRVSPMEALRYE